MPKPKDHRGDYFAEDITLVTAQNAGGEIVSWIGAVPLSNRHLWHWTAQALVVALLMLMSRADWVLSSLYHGDQSLTGVCLAASVLVIAVLATLLPLALLVPARFVEPAVRSLTVAAAIYVFQPAIRALPLLPADLTSVHKIGLAFATLCLAWLAATKLQPAVWTRVQLALIVAGSLFVLSPFILIQSVPTVTIRPPKGMPIGASTIVLLLDEMNADAVDQVAHSLREAGDIPAVHRIHAVGEATISVIPEMFGAPHVPRARVCTPTAVCDPNGNFDFAKLRFDQSDNFHIVGFHHPYCAATGYRSCLRIPPPGRPPVANLLCSFGRLLPGIQASDCDWFEAERWEGYRKTMRTAMDNSPFWQDGGTLFAHLPFPHPPGNLPNAGLAADYDANLKLAAEIANHALQRGRQRYGKDFRLIVTSDHPLRPALWCKQEKYRVNGCAVTPTKYPVEVPYVVVPSASVSAVPTSNAEIFERQLEVRK